MRGTAVILSSFAPAIAEAGEARALLWLLGALTAWRLATCGLLGLGDAEAYDWVWSQFPSASYFDHPPGIAWLIAATTALAGDTPLGVRLGPILLFPATVQVLYLLGRDLFGARAALFGCLALIATPAFHIGGVSASPDTPLAFFWALALLALWRAVGLRQSRWFVVLGIALGLGFLSKYVAVLLGLSAVLFVLLPENRPVLTRRGPWIAAVLALMLALPVLYWNAEHSFASLRFQLLDRHAGSGLSWNNAGRLVFGQLAYISPILLVGYVAAMIVAVRRSHDRAWNYIACMSVPTVAFFAAATLWTREAEPHWPAMGYLAACLGFGQLIAQGIEEGGTRAARARRFFASAVALPAVLLGLLYLHLLTPAFLYLTPPGIYQSKIDLANELRGWPEAAQALRTELASMPANTVVLAYHYTMCSQAAFALGDARLVRCVNTRTDALDFLGLGELPPAADAIYIGDDRYNRPAADVYRFTRAEPRPDVTITRGGLRTRTFHLTRLYGVRGLTDTVAGL